MTIKFLRVSNCAVRYESLTPSAILLIAALSCARSLFTTTVQRGPPIRCPSWNEGKSKKSIVAVRGESHKLRCLYFVAARPNASRTFDNDGTLWAEQPMYFQLLFAIDRIKGSLPRRSGRRRNASASVLAEDLKAAFRGRRQSSVEIVGAGTTNMTPEEFDRIVKKWAATAKHPNTWAALHRNGLPADARRCSAYLRANGFKTFIVSGGGAEFMRAFAERVYGIPPEQIVGTVGEVKFEMRDGKPVLVGRATLGFFNDNDVQTRGDTAKRRPPTYRRVRQLRWRPADAAVDVCWFWYAVLPLCSPHRRRARVEPRRQPLGRLDKGLEEAKGKAGRSSSMKNEWKIIYPFEKSRSGELSVVPVSHSGGHSRFVSFEFLTGFDVGILREALLVVGHNFSRGAQHP